jgi:hypothetical protein
MTPTTYTNVGPFRLRAEKDADILAALEAVGKGNQAALFRAAVRLALGKKLEPEEKAIVERAREGK